MKKQLSYIDLLSYFLGAMIMVFMIFPHLTGITVVSTIVVLVVGRIRKQLSWSTSKLGVLFMLFYLAYLIGVFFTNHEDIAYSYLEYKLSFIIFPIIFSLRPKEGNYNLPIISTGLIIGLLLAISYGIINALLCFNIDGTINCFMTVHISPIHHPSYFMVFGLTSVLLAWKGINENWRYYKLAWIIPYTVLILVLHIMTLSFAAILFLLAFGIIIILAFIYKRFGWKSTLIGIVCLPIIAYLFVTKTPKVENEWVTAKWYAEQYIKNPREFVKSTDYPMSGSEERLILWTAAMENLKNFPLGVGTGNVDDVMTDKLEEYGHSQLANKRMNPHNQFLQTALEIGWIGLVLLLAIIGYVLWLSWKYKSSLLLFLGTSLAFNSLFESMLQRQSGIVFYTFWMCLITAIVLLEKRKIVK